MKKIVVSLLIAGIMTSCTEKGEKKAEEIRDATREILDTAGKKIDRALDTFSKKLEAGKSKL